MLPARTITLVVAGEIFVIVFAKFNTIQGAEISDHPVSPIVFFPAYKIKFAVSVIGKPSNLTLGHQPHAGCYLSYIGLSLHRLPGSIENSVHPSWPNFPATNSAAYQWGLAVIKYYCASN